MDENRTVRGQLMINFTSKEVDRISNPRNDISDNRTYYTEIGKIRFVRNTVDKSIIKLMLEQHVIKTFSPENPLTENFVIDFSGEYVHAATEGLESAKPVNMFEQEKQ